VLFPGVQLYYVVFAEMQEGIRLLNVIPAENIISIRSSSLWLLLFDSLRAVLTVRKLRIDTVVDLELFSRVSSLLGFSFGCAIHAGFCAFHMEGLYRGSFHTHPVMYNHLQHIGYNFLSLVYALAEPAAGAKEPMTKQPRDSSDMVSARIEPSAKDTQHMMYRLQTCCPELSPDKKIVVLNPNGSELLPLRRWPMENYIGLIRRLLSDPDVCIVITGSHAETADAVLICDAVRNQRCINFAGQTSLRELLDLFAISRLLISNDSGPPNFAALTGIPVLVFFGPEAPQCYLPVGSRIEPLYSGYLCSPCVSAYNHRKSACTDNRCLQAITVDMVCDRIAVCVPEIRMSRLQ
jgi:ADP-heptose:LPS heptosyltransferase